MQIHIKTLFLRKFQCFIHIYNAYRESQCCDNVLLKVKFAKNEQSKLKFPKSCCPLHTYIIRNDNTDGINDIKL